jgi:hypothetical protein
LQAVASALLSVGLSPRTLGQRASEVVLFGSRAAGMAGATSDWDILLVGHGTSVHSGHADVVWIPPEQLTRDSWLGSELANHVAAYGRWVRGPGSWRRDVFCSFEAAAEKERAVAVQLTELRRVWPHLLDGAKARHARRVRRDVQRLRLLQARTAVPPTAMLDQAWEGPRSPRETLWALEAELDLRTSVDQVRTVRVGASRGFVR